MSADQLARVWQLWTPNKALGLTGVRAAYAIAPLASEAAVAALEAMCASWPVGAHGVALLEGWTQASTQAWLVQSLRSLQEWKQRQIAILKALGWNCLDSDANFLCARPTRPLDVVQLRQAGIKRIVLASGDAQAVVDRIGEGLGLDLLRGELKPEEKVAIVRAERQSGITLMVGDGVNDAPALAVADVGISMGGTGLAAATESADAVLLVDDLTRLAEGLAAARRARAIAVQSVLAGLGMSFAAMIAAAFGYITVVEGALLQEAIDVAVILNALRAVR